MTDPQKPNLTLAKPPKPLGEMTDDEVEIFAHQIFVKIAQGARRDPVTGEPLPPPPPA